MITEACQVGDMVLGALFIIAALVMAWSAVTSARDRRELWRRVAEARRDELDFTQEAQRRRAEDSVAN